MMMMMMMMMIIIKYFCIYKLLIIIIIRTPWSFYLYISLNDIETERDLGVKL